MTRMCVVWQRICLILSIYSSGYLSNAFSRHHRSSASNEFELTSEERESLSEVMKAGFFKQVPCKPRESCYFEIPFSGLIDNDVRFCTCPEDKPCNTKSPVRTNDVDYYFCGHQKTPVCKRGQVSLILDELHSIVNCRCRKKMLVHVKKPGNVDEFICGRKRSRIWIKKMQQSSNEADSSEYYNVYR